MKKATKPTMNRTFKPMVASVGAAFIMGAGTPAVLAAENPFGAQQLSGGYQQLAENSKANEGKCGEGKCGEGQCGNYAPKASEGNCGEGSKAKEGEDRGDAKQEDNHKAKEAKCGEGSCGGAS